MMNFLMLLVRAPLRISFVGGGTDLPDFYRRSPGRVISGTINKYIYIAIKPTYLVDKFIVKYQSVETVSRPELISHNRVRAALLDLGLTENGLEIASFADIPAKTGLGSSSSFSVALMRGLYAYMGKPISKEEAAEAASRLEIDLLHEPIGKQDQYAASFGGFNIFQFNSDETVAVDPVLLHYQRRSALEGHSLLFFTGISRAASMVLSNQRTKIDNNFETYRKMADSVFEFRDALLAGEIRHLAGMLHEGWTRKKSLAENMSNSLIDDYYQVGMDAGAWGGKILGGGGGGCLYFIAPPSAHAAVRKAISAVAAKNGVSDFVEIPFSFTQSGTDLLFNSREA